MEYFIISVNDDRIKYLCEQDKKLSVVIRRIGDIKCHIHSDGYSFVVEEIIGQMLSNKVADVIINRLLHLCNGEIKPEIVSSLSIEDLRGIGISRAKSQYIICFNEEIINEKINLDLLYKKSDDEVMRELMSIRGIGSWTAKMYLLFVLQRENILPYEDGAFLQAYKWLYNTSLCTPKDVVNQCRCWNPYSSLAARYMYRALDSGMTKTPLCNCEI